jgi:hypothetical protein
VHVFVEERPDESTRPVGDKQMDRVAADIDDGRPIRFRPPP